MQHKQTVDQAGNKKRCHTSVSLDLHKSKTAAGILRDCNEQAYEKQRNVEEKHEKFKRHVEVSLGVAASESER